MMLSTYFNADRISSFRSRILIALPVMLSIMVGSCKKTTLNTGNPATLQVFNALDEEVALRANLSGNHPIQYSTAQLMYNKFYLPNNNVFYIQSFPQPFSVYSETDTLPKDNPVLDIDLDLEKGKVYSLFLHGNKTNAAYTLISDQLPTPVAGDSVTFIRFANFSAGQVMSVNLKGEPYGSLIQNLAFKSVSAFIPVKADMSVTDHEIEIRDQTSGTLIATYITYGLNRNSPYWSSPNMWLYKTNTLVLTGKPGGSGSDMQMIYQMPHWW